MRDLFKALFGSGEESGEESEPTDPEGDLQLAACTLLLELAYADDEFTDDERQHMTAAIRRQWGLDAKSADELIALAERQRVQAVDLWRFTTLIKQHYSLGQKVVLAETMWGLVYADGDLSSKEDYLMRKICGLLDLKPGYLAQARKKIESEGEGGRTPID